MSRALTTLFALLLALCLPLAQANNDGHVAQVSTHFDHDTLMVDADIAFTLGSELLDAAHKGVPLYFTVDLQIVRPRWWWFDKTLVDTERSWRIQYNALTRQWRVGLGELSLPATTLDEGLDLVRHIRQWAVGPADDFHANTRYQGRLRLRLDTSRLARPFQVDALNSKAWSLTTPWKDFTFTGYDAKPRG